MLKITSFYLLILLFFSCQPEELPFQPKSISELTSELTGPTKDFVELRLAFAKAVANALEDVEFRDYINDISRDNTTNYFNEIVFALHKDDIAVGNKSLKEVIEEAVDKETKELYGDQFITKIINNDPLVSIKIPDVFYDFKWETDCYAPMVYANVPMNFGETNLIENIAYHYSGYMDLISVYHKSPYFAIVVKYSEDYLLYNKITKLNHKNIPLLEMIPQLEKCWDQISDFINQSGVSHPSKNNFIYIKRRDIQDQFIEMCEGDYVYYGEQVIKDCNDQWCIRKCIDKNKEVNDVIEKVTIADPNFIDFVLRDFIEDNIDFSIIFFDISDNGSKILDQYVITGIKAIEYYNRDVLYEKDINEEKYELIGKVTIPKVKINIIYKTKNDIFINHRIRKSWFEDDGKGAMMHNVSYIRYGDIVNPYKLFLNFDRSLVIKNSSFFLVVDQSPMNYCDVPSKDEYYNIGSISLIHRY